MATQTPGLQLVLSEAPRPRQLRPGETGKEREKKKKRNGTRGFMKIEDDILELVGEDSQKR